MLHAIGQYWLNTHRKFGDRTVNTLRPTNHFIVYGANLHIVDCGSIHNFIYFSQYVWKKYMQFSSLTLIIPIYERKQVSFLFFHHLTTLISESVSSSCTSAQVNFHPYILSRTCRMSSLVGFKYDSDGTSLSPCLFLHLYLTHTQHTIYSQEHTHKTLQNSHLIMCLYFLPYT
jgi:hypothetical protein